MIPFQVCAACLNTDGKMCKITKGEFLKDYLLFSGLKTAEMNYMPEYLCHLCLAHLKKFLKFRIKCQEAHKVVLDVLRRDKMFTIDAINRVDKKEVGLEPLLSYMNPKKSALIFIDYLPIVPEVRGPYSVFKPVNLIPKCTNTGEQTLVKSVDMPQDSKISNNDIATKEQSVNISNSKQSISTESNDNDDSNDVSDNDDKRDSSEDENNHENNDVTDDNNLSDNNMEEYDLLIVGDENNITFDSIAKEDIFADTLDITNMNNRDHEMQEGTENNGDLTYVANSEDVDSKINIELKCQNSNEKKNRYFDVIELTFEEQMERLHKRREQEDYVHSKYKCEYCFRCTQKEAVYKKHMKLHDPNISGKFVCKVCGKCTLNRTKLRNHARLHAYKYHCKRCDKIFYEMSTANRHYTKAHGTKRFRCEKCDVTFPSEESHDKHLRAHHAKESCYVCGESFVNKKGVTIHMYYAHGPKLALFSTKHKAMLDPSDPSNCITCQLSFDNETDLEQHMLKKHAPKSDWFVLKERKLGQDSTPKPTEEDLADPNYCQDCRLKFFDPKAFQRHLKTNSIHSPRNLLRRFRKKPPAGTGRNRLHYKCNVCDEDLFGLKVFKVHFSELHPEQPLPKLFVCEICGKGFENKFLLRDHMNVHDPIKKFSCPLCNVMFSFKYNMRRHIKFVHTTEKRFQCDHCSYRSSYKHGMNIHIQTVHHKIPYLPYVEYQNRRREKRLMQARKEAEQMKERIKNGLVVQVTKKKLRIVTKLDK